MCAVAGREPTGSHRFEQKETMYATYDNGDGWQVVFVSWICLASGLAGAGCMLQLSLLIRLRTNVHT